ncbi:MAG: transglycosylase SLT domain-containing protein [Gammaproteobacteria bacterium]|jgi:hypothetical protein|nr:transglycosylase SLT domain-containing protein [Gammaproteobacteria bacterium]
MKKQTYILVIACLLAACTSTPPKRQHDLCSVFEQNPDWYEYARQAQNTWGIPKHILMAFVRHESSYKENAKTPYEWFLFIPLGRQSSAKGYAQAKDPVWKEYKKERGGFFKSRGDMEDALDFIGWYNSKTHKQLGISKWNARDLYLAYHEGRGGYKRGTYKKKPELVKYADKVARTASEYGAQLKKCEEQFKCSKWYQIWPLCS